MNFDTVKDYLISEATRMGLAEYEVYFMESSDMSAETLKDEISSFSSGVSGGVCFRCIVDGRMGNASTELLTEKEMKALVGRAVENAKCIESDDKAILFRGSEKYEALNKVMMEMPEASQIKHVALELQKNTYAESEHIADGTQAGVISSSTYMELMNSHGLRLSNRVSMVGAYVNAVIQKDGQSKEDFELTLGLEEDSLKEISEKAVQNALSKLNGADIPSGKYDVIISGKRMRDLLSAYSSAFSAKNAQLGMSLLKGKEGEQIASKVITLVDDPMREGNPMQTNFDGEGVATYRKNVIDQGVLQTLLYDLATADRAGVSSTGNGQRAGYAGGVSIRPYSFYITAGDKTEDELKAMVSDGIYITEFKGMHAGCNAVTGDFSIASEGYRIRDGKLCEVIENFTVAGNFYELLKSVEALADQVQFGFPSGFTGFGAPDALIRGMSVAGQ